MLLIALLAGCKNAEAPADPAAQRGAILFKDMACATCHKDGGTGGTLEGVTAHRNAEWFGAYLKNPLEVNSQSMMPSYDLPSADVEALWAYLEWRDKAQPGD